MTEQYVTVKEAASLLKMHWQTVLNYIKRGELKAVQLNKGYRISHDAIEQFALERTKKAKD